MSATEKPKIDIIYCARCLNGSHKTSECKNVEPECPREFWISLDFCNVSDFEQPNSIHVIEKSALDAALRERDELAYLQKWNNGFAIEKLKQERDQLRAEVAKHRRAVTDKESLNALCIVELQAEVERLQKMQQDDESDKFKHMNERDRLQTKLDLAVEGLRKIGNDTYPGASYIARNTLAKIEGAG